MQGLEKILVSDLDRLSGQLALPSVHVGVKNWVFVGDQPPWLTTGTEVRLARALDRLQVLAAASREFAAAA
jgi:hypothetical protein